MQISATDKEKLFRQALHTLGAPIRKIHLDDSQMDTFIEMATENYIEYIQNWLIESQWANLMGNSITETDFTVAFTTKNYDYITDYTYAYSKIVGLQTGEGGYELKKDYINLQKGVQLYQIPAKREINQIMWFTPPTMDQSIIDPFIGVWSNLFGAEYIGLGSYYIMPASDILMRAADRNLKNRIIRSDMTYKITAGPNGTKFLHLLNVPGGKYDFRRALEKQGKIWYWYYDLSKGGSANECSEVNKDIIKTISDVPFDDMEFTDMNNPSKIWIRRYFIALCKEALGRVRGTYSGKIPGVDDGTDLEMDYQSLLTEGKDEQTTLREELNKRLEKFNPLELLKRYASEAEEINKALKFRAIKDPIKII
jgi:hypothetical protein